jgi:alpha-L-rhamnosidase
MNLKIFPPRFDADRIFSANSLPRCFAKSKIRGASQQIQTRWEILSIWLLLTLSACAGFGADLEPLALKCEYCFNPLGIDTPQPRLSWILTTDRRGEKQTAYEIVAASSLVKLGNGEADLWESGKISTAESINTIYAGRPLYSGQRVFWKVRVWDSSGEISGFSKPAWFEMAMLSPKDWQAKWIQRRSGMDLPDAESFNDNPAPILRKEFALDKKIARARVYVSGLGYFELHLNGECVGDDVLNPGWTSYTQRVFYSAYDVTAQLKEGPNAIGIMLGNGWFHPLSLDMWGRHKFGDSMTTGEPRAIVQLVVEFADGTKQTILTDQTWHTTGGPILRNSVYLGEVYDARKEQAGWDQPGFNDSRWEAAVLAETPKLGPLQAQVTPPIRVTRRLKPVKMTEPAPGVYIFDFGQNFAGWAQLRVKGNRGTRVRLRSGELLYPDGTLNGMTAVAGQIKDGGKDYLYDGVGRPKTAFQLDEYILKGQGTETFTPRFTFHGFRYVEVTGFPGVPTLAALEGLRLNSDVAQAGSFECSNEMFNRIQQMVLWTQLANLFSVQSDCPTREKLGYGGDISASSEAEMLNFDMSRFYAKVAQDFVDASRTNGAFTETAPYVGISDQSLGDGPAAINLGPGAGPIDYGVAQPLLAWQLYQYYGDQRVMTEQYDATKLWVTLLRSKAVGDVFDNGISDHEGLEPKPRHLTGTAFYYYNVKLFEQIAAALGNTKDAQNAEAETERIKAAFNRQFLQPGTGRYGSATQACQAFALYFDLVPAAEKNRALEVLVQDILGAHHGHLSTGFFGTKYMLNDLIELGRSDVAYEMVNQHTFPGWGYMLENGATTLWEHWAISDNIYSQDHPMFGSVSEWFYKGLGGIRPAPDAVGFNKIIIQPQPVADLKWVKASYESVRGQIVSAWSREPGRFKLHLEIPVGSTATVFLPATDNAKITEGGTSIGQTSATQFIRRENSQVVLSVPSGKYDFLSSAR